MKTRVYIAGPMTGLPDYNYPAFDNAEAILRAAGLDFFNPASIGKECGLNHPYDFYIRKSIINLLQCNAILMLPNWAKSRGAALEYTIAKVLNYTEIRLADLPGQQPTTNGSADPTTKESTSHDTISHSNINKLPDDFWNIPRFPD